MLSIGQFSKTCGVSIQTLRYYDQIGIISPIRVNSENGYRYYDVAQIPTLLLLSRLKRYGFSLAQIQTLIGGKDTKGQLDMLKQQKQVLHNEITEKGIVMLELEKQIRNIEQGENIMSYPEKYTITIVNRPDQSIISRREMMGIDDFGKNFGLLFEEVQKEKVTPTTKAMAIYHDKEFNPENSDIEVALGVAEQEKATRILQGGQFAHTIHHGVYSTLADAYGALVQWIDENGYKNVGAPFEIYEKSNMAGLPLEKWETAVYFPIAKK